MIDFLSFKSQIIIWDITKELLEEVNDKVLKRKNRASSEKMYTKFDDKNDIFAWIMWETIFNRYLIWKNNEIEFDNNFHDKYDFKVNWKTVDVKTAEMKRDYWSWDILLNNFFRWDNYLPVKQKPELKDYLVIIRYSLITNKYYIIGYFEWKDIKKLEKRITNVPWWWNSYIIENYILPLKNLKNIKESWLI